jgi:hypothetical protein
MMTMTKWIEVIRLRSVGKGSNLLEECLMSLDKSTQSELVEMKTYRHVNLETDLSIHLHWQTERPEQNGSALGLRIAEAFKEFGLIDHSVWVEKEKINLP